MYDGTWRDLEGVNPQWSDPEWADGAADQPGDPGEPISTRLEGPWGVPWFEGLEDPYQTAGLPTSANPLPWSPNEDVGARERVAAYEGAYRTRGPIQAFGHEPSGGLYGDQALGRIMRFPANIPERYDGLGVWNIDYRDELAAIIAANEQPYVSDSFVTNELVLLPAIPGRTL